MPGYVCMYIKNTGNTCNFKKQNKNYKQKMLFVNKLYKPTCFLIVVGIELTLIIIKRICIPLNDTLDFSC